MGGGGGDGTKVRIILLRALPTKVGIGIHPGCPSPPLSSPSQPFPSLWGDVGQGPPPRCDHLMFPGHSFIDTCACLVRKNYLILLIPSSGLTLVRRGGRMSLRLRRRLDRRQRHVHLPHRRSQRTRHQRTCCRHVDRKPGNVNVNPQFVASIFTWRTAHTASFVGMHGIICACCCQ